MLSVAWIRKIPTDRIIIANTKIIPKNRKIDFLSLNLIKYIIDKGITNSNPSDLTNVEHAIQTKLRNNQKFVFFKKNAIVKTNKKKNNE
tara:strand:- start:11 stop:277 length:267 start_codon:yes stop_codon:yes gene_type:complete